MEKNFKKILITALSIMIVFICALSATSCSGVVIKPGDDGSVTVTPNPDDETVEIHVHSYNAVESSEKSYSCTEDGVAVYRCTCGAEFKENVKAPGHDIRSYEGKAATCFVDGCEPYEKCIRGNCTYTTYKAIPALDHSLTKLANVAPTCTVDGAKDRAKCTRAGCNYSTETVVPALGHIRNRIEGKAATCTQDGYTSYEVCTRAGCASPNLSQSVPVTALGHDLTNYEAKAPTCSEFGWKAYSVCKRCTYSSYTKLEATGHSYKSGYCSSCGQADPQHIHTWNSGEVSVEATCTLTGVMKYTCTIANCGETKYEEIVTVGHSTTRYPAKSPTCTEDGWYAYEECNNCNYSTYAVAPATGHSYNNGIVTIAATCTQLGVRTYSCVNNGCNKTVMTEIEKLGHDWGNWYVHTEATCDSVGQERRICFNNSNHIDNRTIAKLGHDWTEYSVIKNPSCTEEGQKKRTCNNNSAHEEIMNIPVIPHDVVSATGKCNICKNVINPSLDTPEITAFSSYTIFWNQVNGADRYEVRVIYNGKDETFVQTALSFNLEKFFRECNSLDIQLRAMSPDGSTTPNSPYFVQSYSVNEGDIVDYEGVGKTVNLLTGSYTDYGSGTKSIFNKFMFNRLTAGDRVTLAKHNHQYIYSESINDYTNKLTANINNKMNLNASVGINKLFKVTGGYSFEVDGSYEKKTYNETQTAFYDAYYDYLGYQAGIDGFSDPEILYSLLSDEFIEDAEALQNGEMSPEAFVNKYGTHVITAGIYGARFNAHYELLADKSSLETNKKLVTELTISKGIQGVFKGIDLKADSTNQTNFTIADFVTSTDSNMRTVFNIKALGGTHVAPEIAPGDFAAISEKWADSMTNESDYVLIDVPDSSLYFVWDFLGDEYSAAKELLNSYFYASCDEQYEALNGKINGMYKDFFAFDVETGTLTFDLFALQEPGTTTTSLKDVIYMDGTTEIFNGETGKFTIYSKFNGHDVNKVVFEGGYNARSPQNNEPITAYFDGVYIVFTESWTADEDIVIEFVNFAYEAPAGHIALDFSATSSKTITLIASGYNKIVGGDGISFVDMDLGYTKDNFNGSAGINAINGISEFKLEGSGNLEILGGKGISSGSVKIQGTNSNGTKWTEVYYVEKAFDGATGIECDNIIINMSGRLDVYGGDGGDGAIGSPDDVNGEHGGSGGSGGNGAVAIQTKTIIADGAYIAAVGGSGGNGGRGGHGNNKKLAITGAKNGGDGGSGGDGAMAIISESVTLQNSSLNITGGFGGNGGRGGNCGKSGFYGNVGLGGSGGSGAIATNAELIDINSTLEIVDGENGSRGENGT